MRSHQRNSSEIPLGSPSGSDSINWCSETTIRRSGGTLGASYLSVFVVRTVEAVQEGPEDLILTPLAVLVLWVVLGVVYSPQVFDGDHTITCLIQLPKGLHHHLLPGFRHLRLHTDNNETVRRTNTSVGVTRAASGQALTLRAMRNSSKSMAPLPSRSKCWKTTMASSLSMGMP